jgi:hypothetical protein
MLPMSLNTPSDAESGSARLLPAYCPLHVVDARDWLQVHAELDLPGLAGVAFDEDMSYPVILGEPFVGGRMESVCVPAMGPVSRIQTRSSRVAKCNRESGRDCVNAVRCIPQAFGQSSASIKRGA